MMVSIQLFEKCWNVVKRAEQTGELTVEEALDVATRLTQALFCSMMECLADNGEDPTLILTQSDRLHETIRTRLAQVAKQLRIGSRSQVHCTLRAPTLERPSRFAVLRHRIACP
jgi:hypothetical protein